MKFRLLALFLFINILSFHIINVFAQESTESGKISDSAQVHSNASSSGFKREFSQSSKIYNSVKDGVVTILTGVSSGSGFLVDEKGLIVTNHHVVDDSVEDSLLVRFGKNQVIKGAVVEKDIYNDIAIVWVNLKNIKKYSVLKMFTPLPNEPLVAHGEKVLAIGSPLEWETLEDTLTQGIVSKYSNSNIIHDASINHGNSGGPLLNFAGYVVGINTFGPPNTDDNNGIGGSVSILKAIPYVRSAAQRISTLTTIPSDELLPDFSSESYTNIIMAKAYKEANKSERKRCNPYKLKSRNYNVSIVTPPQEYRKNMKTYNKNSKRLTNLNNNIMMIFARRHHYIKPVVTLHIEPKLGQSKATKICNILSAVSAVSSSLQSDNNYNRRPGYLKQYNKYVYKKDFSSLCLINKNKSKTYQPYTFGRSEMHTDKREETLYKIKVTKDSTYCGRYEFDPRYFDTEDDLALKVFSMDGKKPVEIKISPKVKKYIVDDFKPYWDYLEEQKSTP